MNQVEIGCRIVYYHTKQDVVTEGVLEKVLQTVKSKSCTEVIKEQLMYLIRDLHGELQLVDGSCVLGVFDKTHIGTDKPIVYPLVKPCEFTCYQTLCTSFDVKQDSNCSKFRDIHECRYFSVLAKPMQTCLNNTCNNYCVEEENKCGCYTDLNDCNNK